MPPDAPLVSVVVPTRNEADNVLPLWQRLQAALAGVPFELCVVDDSDDSTPAVLSQLAADNDNVRCRFRFGPERAGGLSTAVVAGIGMASGRYVCVMDADLQHPPETIPSMLNAAEAGADLVVASRYMRGATRTGLEGGMRHVVSVGAAMVARLLFSEARESADPLSGFFLCRRVLVDGIEFRPVGFKILLELLVCVPGIRVVDVPLRFEPRASGESKATVGQGLLFIRHCWSLFMHVAGSARVWKFGLVGLSGLAIFLPLLYALSGPAGLHPLLAFVPAFAVSVAWNSAINWRWTFADERRAGGGDGSLRYAERALVTGVLMFGTYAALVAASVPAFRAGLATALIAMLINGLANRRSVRLRSPGWARIAVDRGVQAALVRLAAEIGADHVFVVAADSERRMGLPSGMLGYVVAHRKAALFTEAASHRAQPRTNIDTVSRLLVPVVDGDTVVAVVICERRAPRGFDASALDVAMRAVADTVPALSEAVAAKAEDVRAQPNAAGAVTLPR